MRDAGQSGVRTRAQVLKQPIKLLDGAAGPFKKSKEVIIPG